MTHLCINCNAPAVQRAGDRFTCKKCGYRWDVAHEQANAAFLASQGRQPAEPTVGPVTRATGGQTQPTDEDRLVAALVKYTVADIDELAEAAGVDLSDARLKHEKAAALIRSGRIALDDTGAVVVVDETDNEDGEDAGWEMGAYTTGADVFGLLLDLGVGPVARMTEADAEAIIAGLEGEVDGILKAQGYAAVPATGGADRALLGQHVRMKAAARVYVTLHQPQRSPDWVRTADIDWSEFLNRLRQGQQRLVDQEPGGEDLPFFAVVRHPTRDDFFTARHGTTDWDE